MEIKIQFNVDLKHGKPLDKFTLTPDNKDDTLKIVKLINKYMISDTCVTCNDTSVWGDYMEYRSKDSVIYIIPRRYTDAFNLYVKTLKAFYFKD